MTPLGSLVKTLRHQKSSFSALVLAPWMQTKKAEPEDVLRRALTPDSDKFEWTVLSAKASTVDEFRAELAGGTTALHEIWVVKDFESLSASDQLSWFVSARGHREQRRDGSVQFVFAGAWTPNAAASEWRRTGPTSPPLNRDSVFWAGNPIRSGDLDWVPGDGVPHYSMRALVRDHLRDDWQLLGLLESYSSGLRSLADLERCILALPERDEVCDVLADRLDRVDDVSRHVLGAALEFGVIRGEVKDVHGLESLVVNGLMAPSRSVDRCWEVRPVVDGFMRTQGQSIVSMRRLAPHDFRLLVHNQHLRAGAFLVSQIENLLRNLIVEWYAEGMSEQTETAVFESAPHTRESDGKSRPIVNRLVERRETDRAKSTHSTMNHDPLAAYMDVQDIQLCLQKPPLLDRAQRVFDRPERMVAFLAEFSSYRNAVAHSKDVSIVLVERLAALHETLLGYLGRAAAKSAYPSKARLAEVDEGSVKIAAAREGVRIEFELVVNYAVVLDLVVQIELGSSSQNETIAQARGPRHTASVFILGADASVAPGACRVRVQSGRLPTSR